MVLLWYFRVPVSGSRPSETRTSHVREPREMSCPAFRAIRTPPARKRAHRSHTSALEINIYWGWERVLLIKESRWPEGDQFPRSGFLDRKPETNCLRERTSG